MKPKILIINTCTYDMHYYEFVKPIEEVVKKNGFTFKTVKYLDLTTKDIDYAGKIIICGTSLRDFEYMKHPESFNFIKNYNNSILGICAGMQIVCTLYGCKLQNSIDMGLSNIDIKGFLEVDDELTVYELHNKTVAHDMMLKKEFLIYGYNKNAQAVKHKEKPFFLTLFHPEVRNRHIIEIFLKAF